MARKQGISGFRPKLISIAVASCFAASTALANPTGGVPVVPGSATFAQNGNLLQITNSPNAIINWQSFSIGANEITRFIQQSQASAVLNRVTGSAGAINPSVILGALQSNGRVFLVNPSGILFGAGAQVDVAGLVATSLNLSNADFLAGKLKFSEVPGAGSVVNQGNITSGQGGQVYLVGPAVSNSGIITSPNGEIVLAAGNSVELVNPGTPNLRVEIVAPDNEARNLGQIVVNSGRAGIYAGLVNNSGTISASGAVAEGGKILLKATKNVTLESSSILNASGAGGGTIEVLAKNGGTVNVAGKLDASAPVSGNGGFIETSADRVKVANGTVVTTAAPHGKTGMWLIDPQDFLIDSLAYGGDITGAQLGSNLDAYGGTNVTITSDMGAYGGPYGGNITVNEPVSWTTDSSLTLTARSNVDVNSPITNTGNGGLNIYAGWDGSSPPATPIVTPGIGHIYLPAPITMNASTGKVVLVAGGDIEQHVGTGEAITANSLVALSLGGDVVLNDAGNKVNLLAGGARNEFSFTNSQSLTIGSIDTGNTSLLPSSTVSGITVSNNNSTAAVNVTVTSGNLIVDKDVTAAAGGSGNAAAIALQATSGSITVNTATVEARGGSSESGGAANVMLSAGTTVTLNSGAAVNAIGGGASCCGAAGDAKVTLVGPAGITVASGASILAQGGNNSGSSGNTRGGNAQVEICAGTYGSFCSISSGPITINGSVTVKGGIGGFASNSGSANAGGGNANISLSGTTITVGGTGSFTASGGQGGSANASAFEGSNALANASGGSASVSLSGSGDISVAGNIVAQGGNGGGGSGAFAVGNGTIQANTSGGAADVSIGTAGGITVSGSIQSTGGNAGNAHASGSQAFATAAGGNAFVTLNGGNGAGGKSVVVNGSLGATGGAGGNASGSGFTSVSATAGGGSVQVHLSSTGASIDAGGITVAGGNGGFAAANVLPSGTASPFHSADGGSALVALNTTGPISVNSAIQATGGSGGSGGPRSGGTATIVLAPQVIACEVGPCPPPTYGDVTVNGDVAAIGGAGTSGGSGGNASVNVGANNFTLNGAEIEAYAGANGAATTSISALGNIALNSGNVEASVGCSFPCNGDALVSISAGGNVDLGSTSVTAAGEDSGHVIISAPAGYIHNAGGLLTATDTASFGLNSAIQLTAANGIGTIAAPVRLQDGSEATSPDISLNNTSTGDIAVSFATKNVEILNDLGGLFNGNPTGTYFINAEQGSFLLATGFLPGNSSLLPGQNVSISVAAPGQNITFGPGASIITSGGGTITAAAFNNINVLADAAPVFVKSSGLMTVNAFSGTLTLQGGSTGTGNSAQLVSDGGQNITAATAINLTGGNGGVGNSARIANTAGVQTISGSPTISLTGGAGGAADQGNFAQIFSAGSQDITAGNVVIAAGTSGGVNNFANIVSPLQTITVGGDLTLTGGDSLASATSGGGARIGGLGGATPSATNLMLDVTGNITLTGGSVANAGAAIGSNFNGGQTTDITINAGGGVILNPGSVSGARIGSPAASVAGGDIVVTAVGAFALNSAAGVGSSIRTTDNVTLQAASITQGADSVIQANVLTTATTNSTSLLSANQVSILSATNTNGDVVFNSALPLTVAGASSGGSIVLTNSSGPLSLSGDISAGGALTATSGTGDLLVNAAASVTSGTGTTLTGVNVTQVAGTGISGPLNATATSGSISLEQAGAYTLGTLSAASGAVSVTSSGADVVVGAGSSITSSTGTSLTGANVIQTAGTIGGALNATATSGSVDLTQAGAYTLGAISGTGTVAVTSTAADITLGASSSITSGSGATLTGLNVTQSGGSITGPISASATAGNVTLSQAGAFTLGAVDATGSVAVTSTGADVVVGPSAVISSGTGSSLTGLNVTQSGGTISGPINASATGGNVSLTQAGGYTLGSLNATGAVTVTSTASDVVVGSNISSGTGTTLAGLNVTQSSGTISGLINATATSGDVSLTQAGGYTLGLLSAPVSVTVVSTGGAITNGNAGLNVMSPSATLSAATGVGSIATPIVTQVGGLAVSSGGGEIGLINAGDLTLGNLTFGGANAQIGATGTMVTTGLVSVPAGNLALVANNGLVVLNNVSVSGDIVLNSGAGDMIFDGASVSGANIDLVSGNQIYVGFTTSTAPTTVAASNLLTATSAGNMFVLGGANSGANALLEGLNVDLTVGTVAGVLNVAGGSNGASAQIHSVSPTTITLSFPMLTEGGFFVDGVEGVISNGNTGFFAGGFPAVLGQNMLVTYGTGGTTVPIIPGDVQGGVEQAINQVVVATNEQTTTLTETNTSGDDANNAGTGETTEEKQKKALPICGK